MTETQVIDVGVVEMEWLSNQNSTAAHLETFSRNKPCGCWICLYFIVTTAAGHTRCPGCAWSSLDLKFNQARAHIGGQTVDDVISLYLLTLYPSILMDWDFAIWWVWFLKLKLHTKRCRALGAGGMEEPRDLLFTFRLSSLEVLLFASLLS